MLYAKHCRQGSNTEQERKLHAFMALTFNQRKPTIKQNIIYMSVKLEGDYNLKQFSGKSSLIRWHLIKDLEYVWGDVRGEACVGVGEAWSKKHFLEYTYWTDISLITCNLFLLFPPHFIFPTFYYAWLHFFFS